MELDGITVGLEAEFEDSVAMTLDYASQFESWNTQDKQESEGKKSDEGKEDVVKKDQTQEKKVEQEKSSDHKEEVKKEATHKEESKEEAKGHDQKAGHDSDAKSHDKTDGKEVEKGHGEDGDSEKEHAKDGDHAEKDAHGHEGEQKHEHKKGDASNKEAQSKDGHAADSHGKNPLSPEALFSHVLDTEDIHLPPTFTRLFMKGKPKLDSHGHEVVGENGKAEIAPHDGVIAIPQPLKGTISYQIPLGEHTDKLRPLDLNLSRLMIVELVAALIIFVVFTWLARKIKSGKATQGRIAGLLETLVQFVRKDVGIAVMGKSDGRRFAPFLLTIFFFVLGCNLLGMIPTVGAPTGDILVTGSLALCVFATVVYAGMMKFGFVGFFGNLVPTMGVEGPLGIVLSIGMFFIELFGFFVKHFVLAVRLFANIMAGHLVLAAIIGFIAMVYNHDFLVYLVAPASVAGSVALSCLEVFVAFLQAYVFTFLSALFISSATHKH